ncbi:MAG: T9SS type A sorting domain-containing protein [Calditrichae bacterium]|nr:T9SS type A sorting domain-containing protein [Calditrichia bacterium]
MNLKSIFLLLFSCQIFAQTWDFQREVTPFPVLNDLGVPYQQPFFGGLNAPSHQFLDIDGDNDADLFVQDRANHLIFFRNGGTPNTPEFQWETDEFGDLFVGSWFKFADVDLDGDFDLFAENPFGIIRYFQNTGTATAANFVISADTLRDETGEAIIVDGPSVPEWADMYCANRLDLFLGRISGYTTEYRFLGFDSNNVPIYRHITDTFENLQILTGGGRNTTAPADDRHGANSLTFLDIDDDGDLDLFWGDFFANSIIFIENTGNCGNPNFETANIVEEFPPVDPVDTGGFNIPRFADIDGDGDADMFVSVFGGSGSFVTDKEANFYFYENGGDATSPDFALQTKDFVNSIDIGQNTIPAFADIDNDGDLDMFLSNQVDIDAPGQSNSRLHFFENTGTATAPVFELKDENYLNFDNPLFGSNYAPAFTDIDADSDFDLFLGQWDGKINFWRNDGSANIAQLTLIDANFGSIDIGSNSTPTFADIDADGDADLFIGEVSGNLNFYRNTGTPQNAVFELVTNEFAGINLGFQQYTFPKFADVDRDGDLDLLLGSESLGTFLYRNNGTPQNADFVQDNSFSLPIHLHNSPDPVDIDGDGDLDLVIGVDGGGVVFYKNLEFSVGISPETGTQFPTTVHLLDNYPNPFNPSTTIVYDISTNGSGHHSIAIFNILGEAIREWQFANDAPRIRREIRWDATDASGNPVSSGIYLLQIRSANAMQTIKILLTR